MYFVLMLMASIALSCGCARTAQYRVVSVGGAYSDGPFSVVTVAGIRKVTILTAIHQRGFVDVRTRRVIVSLDQLKLREDAEYPIEVEDLAYSPDDAKRLLLESPPTSDVNDVRRYASNLNRDFGTQRLSYLLRPWPLIVAYDGRGDAAPTPLAVVPEKGIVIPRGPPRGRHVRFIDEEALDEPVTTILFFSEELDINEYGQLTGAEDHQGVPMKAIELREPMSVEEALKAVAEGTVEDNALRTLTVGTTQPATQPAPGSATTQPTTRAG